MPWNPRTTSFFLENPSATEDHRYAEGDVGSFHGFAHIGRMYYRKTGKCPTFYPIFADKRRRTSPSARELRYQPDSPAPGRKAAHRPRAGSRHAANGPGRGIGSAYGPDDLSLRLQQFLCLRRASLPAGSADKPVAVCGNPKTATGSFWQKRGGQGLWRGDGGNHRPGAGANARGSSFFPAHHELYARLSRQINAIYCRYTDQVEPFSIDESWLDVTGSLPYFKKPGGSWPMSCAQLCAGKLGVTISVGVSFNKVLPKWAATIKTGCHHPLYPGEFQGADLSASGFRPVVCRPGRPQGLCPAGHRHHWPAGGLSPGAACGASRKTGGTLWDYAHGIDDTPVKHWGSGTPSRPSETASPSGATFRGFMMSASRSRPCQTRFPPA